MHAGTDADVFLNHPADRAGSNSCPLVVEKQRRVVTLRHRSVEQKLIAYRKVIPNRLGRRIPKRHDPLLSSLACHANQLVAKVNVGEIQRSEERRVGKEGRWRGGGGYECE